MDTEALDLALTESGGKIFYQSSEARADEYSMPSETAFEIAERLQSLGLLRLGSLEELFDGSRSHIAARTNDGTNLFKVNSVDSPQAELRAVLMSYAEPDPTRAEQDVAANT